MLAETVEAGGAALVFGGLVGLAGGVTMVPFPMAVVMGPDSMNTPEMNQSSGFGSLTMRSTPTWKSSELVEVDAATLGTTFVRGSEPVDAQRPTVCPENYGGMVS